MAEKLSPDDHDLFARSTRLSSLTPDETLRVALSPAPPVPLTPSAPEPVSPSSSLSFLPPGERYTARDALGRGGMGEVLLCRDHTIGREVAMKQIRRAGPGADLQARFVRE